ncbi:MAG: ATP-grasp domain-containing protein [Puniceicoccales bacterium]|jgi:carbamoyl-phosphate synthase large subunit|nr:ATP-grasp domain-containing protein [Puniceicoccales bacterium]
MRITILVSAAGRRNKLIACLRESAQRLGVEAVVLAADMNPSMSPACHCADAAFAVPHCKSEAFLPAIKSICKAQNVNLLIPTIDTELSAYAGEKAWFENNGTHLNISAPEVIDLARDKMLFHRFLEQHNVPSPATGEAAGLTPQQLALLPWPCIFKPRDGSRSVGIVRAKSPDSVPDFALTENYIWQECWRGKEFTVNFFTERGGRCRCVVPHERAEVRDGEVAKGITRRIAALEDAVRRMAEALPGAYGAQCAQAIVRGDGQFVLFELNARFGGGYPLVDNAGAHFAQWLIEETLGLPSTVNNDWKENRVMLRYDDAIFIDADTNSKAPQGSATKV